MNELILNVADKDILIVSNMDLNPLTTYFHTGSNPSIKIYLVKCSRQSIKDKGAVSFTRQDKDFPDENHCMIMREYQNKISLHPITTMLAYITGLNSYRYDSIHGCGTIINSNGKERSIMLIGESGAGKTTLHRNLNGQTLDDEILMMDHKKMSVVGKQGAITISDEVFSEDIQYRMHQQNAPKEAMIDAIFLLDKYSLGGRISQVESVIPRKNSVFDLETNMKDIYLSLPDIKVKSPVYRLGTAGNIEETKKAILSVI